MSDWFGQNIPKLGFGLMRLPKLPSGEIDLEQTKEMVDLFIGEGLTYFDTAYVYDNGKSEEAAREALVYRHPRKSFTMATKLNVGAGDCKCEEDAKKQFYTSLERTGAGYFDYYLLHCILRDNYKKYEEYHIWEFVKELKEKGLIKHYGFSFHADPELLEQVLTEHPDVEFVQLQLNYADWESENVQSRKCYEIARKHKKSIVVMEPLKGGALANPPEEVKKVFDATGSKASYASWGIRYVAGMEGILTVLSGMSTVEQVKDNLSYMAKFKPMEENELAVIEKAKEALKSVKGIECTACHYCTEGCPVSMPIPEIFSAANKKYKNLDGWNAKIEYGKAISVDGVAKASDCTACGQCESACPQHLPIISLLSDCAKDFE